MVFKENLTYSFLRCNIGSTIFLFVILTDHHKLIIPFIIIFILYIIYIICCIPLIFSTKYILAENELCIKYWKYHIFKIPYNYIISCKNLTEAYTSIEYNSEKKKHKTLILHPKNQDDFIKMLEYKLNSEKMERNV